MRTSLRDAPGTLTADSSDSHRRRGERLIRAALHVACWIPFITTAADSWRGPWRAVGDNARLALQSWSTLSGHIPLIGQPNELPGAPHDLGPMQYWLLTLPVHADTSRGVLWGAVLLAMLAVSLAVEAGYSVLGVTGGLLASGVVIAIVTWFPGFATRPEDNPNFGMIFFVATFSVCLAVLSGHRNWWPVLVVTASIAAQAHLTYTAASVGLVLIAAIVGLADEFRAKGRYWWLIAGLAAGAACWVAPLSQQFASPAGQGNMSQVLHAEGEGRHVGFAYALKAMASLAAPSSLWWRQDISRRPDLYQVLGSKPAAFGLVILIVTAAILVMAMRWLRSRELVGLAAVSLLVTVSAVTSFALVPVPQGGLAEQQHDLVYVMFAAVVLGWLTAGCAAVLAAVKLISGRPGRAGAAAQRAPGGQPRPRPAMSLLSVRGAAALLLVTTVLLGAVRHVAHYAGAGTNSLHVSAALATVERSLPSQPVSLSVSSSRQSARYQVLMGLCWALTANGYHSDTYRTETTLSDGPLTDLKGPLTDVAVTLRGPKMTVTTVRINPKSPGIWSLCTGH
jgi:hypothetical protein